MCHFPRPVTAPAHWILWTRPPSIPKELSHNHSLRDISEGSRRRLEPNAQSSNTGLFLSEETITESSLYNIALAHQNKDIVITLATKPAV
jgi:hypothetical protein